MEVIVRLILAHQAVAFGLNGPLALVDREVERSRQCGIPPRLLAFHLEIRLVVARHEPDYQCYRTYCQQHAHQPATPCHLSAHLAHFLCFTMFSPAKIQNKSEKKYQNGKIMQGKILSMTIRFPILPVFLWQICALKSNKTRKKTANSKNMTTFAAKTEYTLLYIWLKEE